jgi:hypothetical protein
MFIMIKYVIKYEYFINYFKEYFKECINSLLDYIQIKYSFTLKFFSETRPCNRFNLESLNILRCDFEG